jgi:uncharacterized protein (TIGR00299 family) protein
MKTAFFECATGIAGDMTLAALVDAGADFEAIRQGIASLGLPGVELSVDETHRCGFRAKSLQVAHPEQHAHRHYSDIVTLIENAGALTPAAAATAQRIFRAIAEAEAGVHGVPMAQVHFHEVGAIDSIVDIVGVAIALDLLGIESVAFAPIPTGRGSVKIDHGVCAVPTPATVELLKGVPLVDVPLDAELTTPTGAAFVKALATQIGPRPEMTIQQIGCGAGTKDFPDRPNILRVFIGTASGLSGADSVCLLETNLDDVSGEVVGHAFERLLTAGALDVFSTPILMKKNRPGVMLSALCNPGDIDAMEDILFTETGTLGIRRQVIQRSKQNRKPHSVETSFGSIAGKLSWRGTARPEFSPEYEDCARIAQTQRVSLREVAQAAMAAYAAHPVDPSLLQPPRTSATPAPAVRDSSHSHDHSHDHGHSHDHSHSHDHDHGHSHDH